MVLFPNPVEILNGVLGLGASLDILPVYNCPTPGLNLMRLIIQIDHQVLNHQGLLYLESRLVYHHNQYYYMIVHHRTLHQLK